MQVIRSLAEAAGIADIAISGLTRRSIEAVADDIPFDFDVHGYFVVVEVGDSVETINSQVGFDVLCRPIVILEDRGSCWSMLFIIDDSGNGVEIFVPKQCAIDLRLLAMLEAHSNPGDTT